MGIWPHPRGVWIGESQIGLVGAGKNQAGRSTRPDWAIWSYSFRMARIIHFLVGVDLDVVKV